MKLPLTSAFKHTVIAQPTQAQNRTVNPDSRLGTNSNSESAIDPIEANFTSEPHPLLIGLKFKHGLRKYQNEILDLVQDKLSRRKRDVHVVAPPGAGKTIIGLQIISTLQRPALILCPNTTIQSQWGDKLDLFLPNGSPTKVSELIGTHEDKPLKPITVLTYQALSIPGKEQDYLEQLAHKSWVKELTSSRRLSYGEAELRILEIKQNNASAHKKEIGRHLSRLRKNLTEHLDLKEVLHKNALEMVKDLRRQGVEVVIFDECHHLTDYWAAIMHHILKALDEPIVVALTGTPPDGKSGKQESRYAAICGKADYQVPTPALVREGGLSPFQDLVYFVEPSANERMHFEVQTKKFYEFVEKMLKNTSFINWMKEKVFESQKENFAPEDEEQQEHERLQKISESILKCAAANVESELAELVRNKVGARSALPQTEDFLLVLEEYASTNLKLSSLPEKQADYFEIKHELGKLGYGVTEGGLRKRASVQDRILAFSTSKFRAAERILNVESEALGDYLRAIVVTDFERMSATTSMTENYLEEEVGGAIGVLKHLINSPISEKLYPCMVTGSIVLIDSRISEEFLKLANQYLKEQGGKQLEIEIKTLPSGSICQVTSTSTAWESRLYVGLATRIFEKGLAKCLIGTRALFGEGWDSQELNTLIDLTTTTASVSVNQLRGRSIRINTKSKDPRDKTKVANNWDVVCVAPEVDKGLNDYERFSKKHTQYYGIADDGQIEKGVGHVHPALSDISDNQLLTSYLEINRQMLIRAANREKVYKLWQVGEAYQNQTVSCLDIQNWNDGVADTLLAPHLKFDLTWQEHRKQMKRELTGMFADALYLSVALALSAYFTHHAFIALSIIFLIGLIGFATIKRYQIRYRKIEADTLIHMNPLLQLDQICKTLLSSLKRMKLVNEKLNAKDIVMLERASREMRVYLKGTEADARIYAQALKEILSPPGPKSLLMPRYQYMSLNKNPGSIFRAYLNGRMELNLEGYYAVPTILARSAKGKKAFEEAWNKRVSPGSLVEAEKTRIKGQFYSNNKMKVYERWIWQ